MRVSILPPTPSFLIVVAVPFVVIHVEFTSQAIAVPAVVMPLKVRDDVPSFHIQQRAQHAAQVNSIVGAASVLYRRQQGKRSGADHEPFHLNRKDVEDDHAVRKEKGVSNEDAQDRSGRADRGLLACRIQQRLRNCSADSANEKEFRECPAAPQSFQVGPKHPETEHVKKDVKKAAVEKDVCHKLPQVKPVSYLIGHQAEFAYECGSTCNAVKDLQEKRRRADNDQRFDNRADSAWSKRTK